MVISAKNPEASIKISSKIQVILREAIDSHDGRNAASNPYKAANVNAFYEKSLIPLRSALLKKATFVKERFAWIKHVRIQLERREFRLILIVIPNDQVKNTLKRGNFLPFAELNVGLSLEAMSQFDNLRWKKIRDPQGAPDLAAPPVFADNFNDEVNLTTPVPDTNIYCACSFSAFF